MAHESDGYEQEEMQLPLREQMAHFFSALTELVQEATKIVKVVGKQVQDEENEPVTPRARPGARGSFDQGRRMR